MNMINKLDYRNYKILRKISSTKTITVYRAERLTDHKSVVLKVLNAEYPALRDIVQLKQEYLLLKALKVPDIVQAFDFIKEKNSYALVLEDFSQGKRLKELIPSDGMDISVALNLIMQLLKLLEELHKENIIHKDINPYNIMVLNDQLKLIDFSIATRLPQGEEDREAGLIEGNLAYISPEQTGRMNRAVDFRTDYYSIGVTLYEMLTGKLPFEAQDAIGWVHAHIARQARPPYEIRSEIPVPLSNIVMKLLSKAQEDRYATAYGLREDLEYCQMEWLRTHKISDFQLAQHEQGGLFTLPHKLYGRDNEIKKLHEAYDEALHGNQVVLFISGYSGIGKTSLINEIQQYIIENKTYFVRAKFDEYARDIPYSAQPLRKLIRQLLSDSPETLKVWYERINIALYPNAQVMIDVIPELAWLLGKQPPVPELSAKEAKKRFESVFIDFMNVFIKHSNLLVMCFDDLQSADIASLELIENITTSQALKNFLLIGTYRSNEVSKGHLLLDTISAMKKAGVKVYEINLGMLSIDAINQLIKDSLHTQLDTNALAQLVQEKTGGNPFFVNALLTHLYEKKYLYFSQRQGDWTWDIENIRKTAISENVTELLVAAIDKLPIATKQAVQVAACIGSEFDLRLLAKVSGLSPQATANILWKALQEKIITPIGESYKFAMIDESFAKEDKSIMYQFVHDRIKETALMQLSETQRQMLSLNIGRLNLALIPKEKRDEKLFQIINYFQTCLSLITDKDEKMKITKLSLKAARKAKNAVAYHSSEIYYKQAITLLGSNGFKENYSLCFESYHGHAESLCALYRFSETEAQCSYILEQAKTNVDKAKILILQTKLYVIQTRFGEAVDKALLGLNLLQVKLSRSPNPLLILTKFLRLAWQLRGKRIYKLLTLAVIKDPKKQLVMDLIDQLYIPAFQTAPKLLAVLVIVGLEYNLRYGVSASTAVCLAYFASFYNLIFRNYDRAHELGQLSIKLAEKHANIKSTSSIYTVIPSLVGQKLTYKEGSEQLLESYRLLKQINELNTANYTICSLITFLFLEGNSLAKFSHEVDRYKENFSEDVLNSFIDLTSFFDLYQKSTLALMDPAALKDFLNWTDRYFAEEIPSASDLSRTVVLMLSLIQLYMLEQWDRALAIINKIQKRVNGATLKAINTSGEYFFYSSLVLLKFYPKAKKKEKKLYMRIIKNNLKVLKLRSELSPGNYAAKYLLIKAALSLYSWDIKQGMLYYEQSIESAQQHNMGDYIEAIINEFIGDWYAQQKLEKNAYGYLRAALYSYTRWGASTKEALLLKHFPNLSGSIQNLSERSIAVLNEEVKVTKSVSHSAHLLELAIIMRSAQAISKNIILKDLLVDLIKIMIESSGAEYGMLLLMRNEKLLVEAISYAKQEEPVVLQHETIDGRDDVCVPIVRYVKRTGEVVLLDEAKEHSEYMQEEYIKNKKVISVLCLPILHQNNLIGILYLENNLVSYAFSKKHVEILQLLASQAAISLEISNYMLLIINLCPINF